MDLSASLWHIFLTEYQIINQINIFFSAALRGLPLRVSLLTMPVSRNYFSSLLMLLFVHHLFGDSFINSVALYPFTDEIFYQNLIFIAKKHVYKHCSNVCDDVILMPQFLKVVQQHILGVVGNFIYCSVANLTDFPAMKKCWKSVKIWQNYRHNRVAHF